MRTASTSRPQRIRSAAVANGRGVHFFGNSNTVGGISASARNIISGNTDDGVLADFTATANVIAANYIGTDVTGTTIAGLGNGNNGVDLLPGGNTVGGNVAGAGNVIA